ncbi:MAG: NAD-dependent dihydropyrimidine dehydrogenase subunit PreA [Spirochaetota bacterium]
MSTKAKVDLSVEMCGLRFNNPFLLSSSPVSNCAEMIERAYEHGWAGVSYKTLNSDRVEIIHPSPRMNGYDYEGKRLVGLQNVEMTSDRPLRHNLADILYLKKKYPDRKIIVSIMGFSNDEWAFLAKASEDHGADMLELNFSCPHMSVEGSGYKVGQSFHLIEKFTGTVKRAVGIPVLAKLTPNITDMTEAAVYAKNGGADGVSAINTVRGISEIGFDDFVAKPNVFGRGAVSGLSGPAVKPIGLRFVAEMAQCKELGLPISGMGGIETWVDCLEYLVAGATTLQVTTGIIHYGYRIVEDMIEGLSDWMEAKGVGKLSKIIGKAVPQLHETGEFDLGRQGIATYDLDKCIGCGQCHIVCHDAGGQALIWDSGKRRPGLIENKCLSCMICSFVCPVPGLIGYTEKPKDWKRLPTPVMDEAEVARVSFEPFTLA